MREHMGLYKGKREDNGEWIRGFYAHFIDLHKKRETHRIYRLFAESDCGDFYPDYYEVDPNTVGEHTGLEDKYGNLIFEGDIVHADDFFTAVVEWDSNHARYVLAIIYEAEIDDHVNLTRGKAGKLTVIGNVTDNPELLKGGEGDG